MSFQATINAIQDRLARGMFKNEAEVRQGIVNELLRELGWSLGDTTVVRPEYSIEEGRVDYALCCPPLKPVALIEVKNIGKIDSRAERQLFSYAFHAGVPILVLTDGRQWQFFYTFGHGDYEDRRVCVLDLTDSDSGKNVNWLQRYLGYPSVENKAAIQAIESDYHLLSSQREAVRHLPEAWHGLLVGGDAVLIELVAEATESVCGHRPSDAQVLDFLKNLEGGGIKMISKMRERPSRSIESVPEAWHGLLSGRDAVLIKLVVEATEGVCGNRPSDAQVLDFLGKLGEGPILGEFPPKPKPSPARRSPIGGRLIVTMPNGEQIQGNTIQDTFVAAIEKLGEQFGMNRLADLGIERFYTPILATSRHPKFRQVQSGSYYILVAQSTKDKEWDLKKIAKGLGIELEIDYRPKETA